MSYFEPKARIQVSRGDICYIEEMGHLNEFGYRAGRPGIIISDNTVNHRFSFVSIVPLTTQTQKPSPTHVAVQCKEPSTALCEMIQAVSKDRVGNYIRSCISDEMSNIEIGICSTLGIANARVIESAGNSGSESVTTVGGELIAARAECNLYKKLYSQLLRWVTRMLDKK